ncbi:MAG TPA: glycosyltransferase family 2 protein [Nakamurella multipartita]|nr:glycosyltransferase family 2 protein [Nakamurella multipartita]
MARIVVVVVTYNSATLLPDFFDSLDEGLRGVTAEVVVADNASSDSSVDVTRGCRPDAIVVPMGRNAGYAAGINAAVAAAGDFDAVLILNPDVRLGAGCAAELFGAMARPRTGITVPRLLDAKGDLIWSMRREPTIRRAFADALVGAERAGRWAPLGEVNTDDRTYLVDTVTDWAEGSTQLVSAECWHSCGPWDESFFLYSEETEFDLRARDHGFLTRFVASASAVHLEGGSAGSPALWALLTVNRIRLFRRRNGRVRTAFFWFASVLRELSRSVLGSRTSRAALRAILDPRTASVRPGPDFVKARSR